MLDVVVVDTEVYSHYFVLVALELPAQNVVVIENQADLKAFYEKHKDGIWCCYNCNYDGFIIKAALKGETNTLLKACSDSLIRGEVQGRLEDLPINVYEVNQDIVSLKMMEGYLGLEIKETDVPFDLDRQLSDTEKRQVIEYCKKDVFATYELLKKQKALFKAKLEACKQLKLSHKHMGFSNKYYLQKLWPDMKWEYGPYKWKPIEGLRIEKYKKIPEFYEYVAKNMPDDAVVWDAMELTEDIFGMNQQLITVDGIIAIGDDYVASNEEEVLIRLQIYDPFLPHTSAPLAPLFKRYLNPQLIAQMVLRQVDLIERIEEATSARLVYIQPYNLVYMAKRKEVDKLFLAMGEWHDRLGFSAVMSSYDKFYSWGYNEVLMAGPDKPFIVGLLDGDDAITTAIRENLAHGRLVSESIDSRTELRDFQIVFNVPASSDLRYQGKLYPNKVARFYVSTAEDASDIEFVTKGELSKVLGVMPTTKVGLYPALKMWNESTIGVPLPADLDKEWYKREAQRRVDNYREKEHD